MDSAHATALAPPRRVRRSFGFIDLCGFCDLADAHGDEVAAGELGVLRSTVRRVAAALSVRVDKWLGDGAMLIGVEGEPLVASILAISDVHRESGLLPLRAGIASGDVLLLDGDSYLGRPVNLAARLSDEAGPDQVLASSEDLRTPPGSVVQERMKLEIKGFAKPVPVVSLASKGPRLRADDLRAGDRRLGDAR